MRNFKRVQGFKGGTTTVATPTEIEDTIQSTGSAYIVDLISEGPIEELVNVYIDEAPFNKDDFPTVEFDKVTNFRYGLPQGEQTALPGRYAGAKVPLPVPQSSKLRKGRPIIMFFNSETYPDATSILVNIKVPSLAWQYNKEDATMYGRVEGDLREYSVAYSVELYANGVLETTIQEVLYEKSSKGFLHSTRVPLKAPGKFTQWRLRIVRQSEDELGSKKSNDTYLDSVVVETNYNYTYPNCAIAALSFDAMNYPSVGQRAYDVKLLKIRVPVGYTPTQYDADGNVTAAAIYPSIWTGDFTTNLVWTDNPAWIFYDIITNRRYGLGEFISEEALDKWTLYSIAKYCDELVDSGTGEAGLLGQEPRFTCNLFLTTTEEAYTVINNLSSVFRGITYWLSGKIFPVQDRDKTAVQLFTNANVMNGIFTYASTGKNQRRTVVQVRWNDPSDFYRPRVELVEDTEGIIRFGYREFDLAAFACTSRGQAHRAGKWALLSERLETEVVTFEVGYDGIYSRPGDIVEIYDDLRVNRKQAGRTLDMDDSKMRVILDRPVVTGNGINYELTLSIPKGNRDPGYSGSDTAVKIVNSDQIPDIRPSFLEIATVSNMFYSGNSTICDVSGPFSEKYIGGTWTINGTHPVSGKILGAKDYRILNIKETEEKSLQIMALEHSKEKFEEAERSYTVVITPQVNFGDDPINPPSSLTLTPITNITNEEFQAYIEANWTASDGQHLDYHVASGRNAFNPSGWYPLTVTNNGTRARLFPANSGRYEIIVGAKQVGGKLSSTISAQTDFGVTNPLGNSSIPVSGIILLNAINTHDGIWETYAKRSPEFQFVLGTTGILGKDDRRAFMTATKIRFKNSSDTVISDWFSLQEGETIAVPYNFTGITGWPMRNAKIEAKTVDYWGNSSASTVLNFKNPAPASGSLTILTKTDNSFSYMFDSSAQLPTDFSGLLFWTSTGVSMPSQYTVKSSTAGEIIHNLNSKQVNVWWAAADDFLLSDLNISGPKLIDIGQLANTAGAPQLLLSGHTDSWNNEYNTLYSTWTRFVSGDISNYYVYLKDTSGSNYNYVVPQPETGNPYFHFDSVIPDRSYQVQVQGKSIDGRLTAMTSLSSAVFVPKPKIRFLQVEGRSYFWEPTSVRPSEQIFGSNGSIDFSQGNIIRVNLTNGVPMTLDAQNIISGATYLLYMYRQAGGAAVNFSSAFKWSNSEAPELTTSVGSVDVISAFAIDSTSLYGVVTNNLG